MSFKNFIKENKIVPLKYLPESFKSSILSRISNAAKVSAGLEKISADQKDSAFRARRAERGDKGDRRRGYRDQEENYSAERGFKNLNKLLYKYTNYKALSEIPDEMFFEVSVDEIRKKAYKEPNYVKFFIGTDESTGAEQLVGIVRGSKDTLYTDGSSLDPGNYISNPEQRVDRLAKGSKSIRGNQWNRRSTTNRDHGILPSQKALAEHSDTVFVLDLNKVNADETLDMKGTIADRKESQKGDIKKFSDSQLQTQNLKRYSELKRQRMLPSDFDKKFIEINDTIYEFKKKAMENRDVDAMRKVSTLVNKTSQMESTILSKIYYIYDNITSTSSNDKYEKERKWKDYGWDRSPDIPKEVMDARYGDQDKYDKLNPKMIKWKKGKYGNSEEKLKELSDKVDEYERYVKGYLSDDLNGRRRSRFN